MADARTDDSTRQRILAATAEVLGRNGRTKLSLSEVALQAEVSRPTLYRYFGDKRELLDGSWCGSGSITSEQSPKRPQACRPAKDSTLRCESSSNTSSRIRVSAWSTSSLPRSSGDCPGSSRSCESAWSDCFRDPTPRWPSPTAVRVAVAHYLVRSDDDDDFLAQLRHAARTR